MRVFVEVAARYGVDPDDEEAVAAFFVKTLPGFSEEEQEKVFDELLSRDGEEP